MSYTIAWDPDPDNPNPHAFVLGEREFDDEAAALAYAEQDDETSLLIVEVPSLGMDSDLIPEGLNYQIYDDRAEIRDAQDHLWVTIHRAGNGDPETWRREIVSRIRKVLGA